MSDQKLTPAMQQYYDMKEIHKDAILFFRMGDFYEMFGEDAHIAHRVLGISITSRNKNAKNPEALAGIPYHAKEKYLPRLVNAGYKVAIAEQISDPKLKGIVKREVVRVVTPATLSLEGDGYSTDNESNYIVSIVSEENKYALSMLDISTNNWITGELNSFESLASELYKVSPREVILEKKLFSQEKIKEILSKKYSLNIYYFETPENPRNILLGHFHTQNLEGFALEKKQLSIRASAMIIEYLKSNQKTNLGFLENLKYESFTEYMTLDESTIRNLDIIYNFATKSSKIGTLLGIIDDTKTAMGGRLIRESLLSPLQNLKSINERLDIVEELYKDPILLEKIQSKLKLMSDIDSIMNRIALARALPRDLINLKKSLQSILDVMNLIKIEGGNKLRKRFGV